MVYGRTLTIILTDKFFHEKNSGHLQTIIPTLGLSIVRIELNFYLD